MWKLERGRDPGVIGRPEARWCSVSLALSDDFRTTHRKSATEKDKIDPLIEGRAGVQEMVSLTTGRGASKTGLDRGVGEPRRDDVVIGHAAAVARRVEIANKYNR